MSSGKEVGLVVLSQTLVFRRVPVTAADLTIEGVFVLDAEEDPSTDVSLLELDAGLQLHGLQVMDGGEDATSTAGGRLVTIRCVADAGAALMGESLGPNSPTTDTAPEHRFTIVGSAAAFVGVDRRPIQFLYDAQSSRWWVPDWGALGGQNPAHWAGSVPASTQEAIARLAAGYHAVHGVVP